MDRRPLIHREESEHFMTARVNVIFGEAERGEYHIPYFCQTLTQLDEYFGNPPNNSKGIYYAVQSLLFHQDLIFIRVLEEGFSSEDYLIGLESLESSTLTPKLAAICTPGLGDQKIMDEILVLCTRHRCILITNEADFYDYLTSHRSL